MPNFDKSKDFQLRSGNVVNAPFKMMGSSSPMLQTCDANGMCSAGGATDGTANKPKLKTSENLGYKKDQMGGKKNTTLKTDKNKEIRGLEIKDEDSDTFGGEAAKLDSKPTVDEAAAAAGDGEKKMSLWQKFQAHHDSGNAKKVEAEFKDAAKAIGGKGYTGGGGDAIRTGIAKTEAIKTSDAFKKNEADKKSASQSVKDKQTAEMHKSKLALNEQKIITAQIKEEERQAKIKSAQNEIDGNNETAYTPTIIKNLG